MRTSKMESHGRSMTASSRARGLRLRVSSDTARIVEVGHGDSGGARVRRSQQPGCGGQVCANVLLVGCAPDVAEVRLMLDLSHQTAEGEIGC